MSTVLEAPPVPPGRAGAGSPALPWIAVLLLGGALRLFLFPLDRPFWTDEAMLAANVAARDFAGLLRPLDFNQAAPLGFLFAQRFVVALLGPAEPAFRLVPLLGGLISLPLFALVARRILPDRRAALAVTLLFALSASLVYYSAEAKQYSTGVLAAVTLLLVTIPQLEARGAGRRLLLLWAVGALALVLSHSSIFTLAACGLALFAAALARRDRPRLLALAAVGGTWALQFGLLYFFRYRRGVSDPYLQEYWADGFMPLGAGLFDWARRSVWVTLDPGGLGLLPPWLVGAALLAGGLCLLRGNRLVAAAVLGPGLLALGASAARVYPFAGRLILFTVPLMLLALGALLACAYRRSRWVGHAAAALLVLSAGHRLYQFPAPERIDARPAFAWLADRAAPGDALLVVGDSLHLHYLSHGVAAFYHEASGLRRRGVRLAYVEPEERALPVFAGARRTWLLRTRSAPIPGRAPDLAEQAFGPVRVARLR